jgi:hypothetical protein
MTNDYSQIKEAFDLIVEAFERDQKRHMMDQHLPISMQHLLEEQIIPQLEAEFDYDPSPYYLYDNDGGEPPVTLSEMHEAARARKLDAWK